MRETRIVKGSEAVDAPHEADTGAAVNLWLGGRIRALRRARGMSQEDLAEVLDRSPQQVQKYETGRSRISVGALVQVAAALGAPLSTLLPPEPVDNAIFATTQKLLTLSPASQNLVCALVEALSE